MSARRLSHGGLKATLAFLLVPFLNGNRICRLQTLHPVLQAVYLEQSLLGNMMPGMFETDSQQVGYWKIPEQIECIVANSAL